MKSTLREVDDIPVTLVVAIAYGTLAVVTKMLEGGQVFYAQLITYGMLSPDRIYTGEVWRLLAHAFLHGGIVHLLFNMMTLWSLGPALERSLGSVRFALLYVVSALGGGLAVCWSYPAHGEVIGGSGALFGMLGAAVAMNMRSGRHLFAFLEFEGPRRLMGVIAVNLVLGFLIPFVSNTAHVGGLVAGFAFTFLWLRPGAPTPARRRWRAATAALFAGACFAALFPVTRGEWLARRYEEEREPVRKAALRSAALRTGDVVEGPRPDPPRRR